MTEKFPSMNARAKAIKAEVHKRVTQITADRVEDPSELEASTPEEKQQKLLQKSREVWRQFAVHGITFVDKYNGQQKLLNKTDLDGEVTLGILKMAGFDTSDLQYVKPGESVPGRIMVDTGYESGLVVKDNGTAFFDHHGKDSTRASISTAKLVYRILAETGFLERTPALDALTKFVTQVDNQTHPDLNTKEFWENSDKTILGLYRFMNFEKLLEYFQDGRSPIEALTPEELEKYSPAIPSRGGKPEYKLIKGSKEQRRNIDQSKEKIQELEQGGFAVQTRFGRILVDIGKKVLGGQQATRAYGYDGYLIYSPDTNSFFCGLNGGKLDLKMPPQGVVVRESMWIKPRDNNPLKLILQDILSVLGSHSKLAGELRDFVEKTEKPYIVKPERNPDPSKRNYVTRALGKFAIFPPDFQPERNRAYRVIVEKDTAPGEQRGVLYLKVISAA